VALDGFLNLLKPPGMTSHEVVAWARSQLGLSRIGHLGTLDPAAAGVLPLSLGKATRLFDYASGPDKAYRAEIAFGLQTDTLDAEGAVVARSDASGLTESALRALLPQFLGEIEQIPPAFSSVSVGGRRLHQSARAGARVALAPRRVTIKQLDLVDFTPGARAYALMDIVCTSGTYIRALADDLGRAAGCGACLGFLVRTRAGRFELAHASTLEEAALRLRSGQALRLGSLRGGGAPPAADGRPTEGERGGGVPALHGAEELLLPLDWPLVGLPEVVLTSSEAVAFVRGTRVSPQGRRSAGGGSPPTDARQVRAYHPGGLFLGLGEAGDEGVLQPRVVLRSERELPT
jgi:tRNA pseudouridine55 synthase